MSKRLSDEDRRAVDMLLDRMAGGSRPDGSGGRGNGNGGKGNGGSGGSSSYSSQVVSEPRIRATEQVLSLLDALPAGDPPADLVSRTLKRLERGGRGAGMPATSDVSAPAAYRPQQPHA